MLADAWVFLFNGLFLVHRRRSSAIVNRWSDTTLWNDAAIWRD